MEDVTFSERFCNIVFFGVKMNDKSNLFETSEKIHSVKSLLDYLF